MTNESEPVQVVTPVPPPDPAQDDFLQAMQIIEHSEQEALAKGNLGDSYRSDDTDGATVELKR